MSKLTRSTAVKAPNRRVRSRAVMIGRSRPGAALGGTGARDGGASACGSRAVKAASTPAAPVRRRSPSGEPVATTRPSFMATSQSKASASCM